MSHQSKHLYEFGPFRLDAGEREKREFVLQITVAMLYARLGQKEQALERLERSVEDRNHYVIALNVEPLWNSYRTTHVLWHW